LYAVEAQFSKREKERVKISRESNERRFRESLSLKVSSTVVGLWLLVAEHLRLGSWDLIKGYTGQGDNDITPRIAMQVVNEAALCQSRIRQKNYITHKGFELLNGFGYLVTDEGVHEFLNNQSVEQSRVLQETLSMVRYNNGHFQGNTVAIDPHRIMSATCREMPKKKKRPNSPSGKMLQTFFALNTGTGQPIACTIGTTEVNTSKATIDLLDMVKKTNKTALILADKEHFTEGLIKEISRKSCFEYLVPAVSNERIRQLERSLDYTKKWAGYAIAETAFNFSRKNEKYRLIAQREGETEQDYVYKSFLTLSERPAIELLCDLYDERWTIEDFFNFDGAMGFDRASTFNLNIRYAKMSLAMLAQAATYQFRQKLPEPYKRWNAMHMVDAIFNKMDGDIRVHQDTIIVTCYNTPGEFNLPSHYQGLPQKLIAEGINPKVPWMYNFKLDFRFK